MAKRTDIELRKIVQKNKYLAARTNKDSTEEGNSGSYLISIWR
jgi:hypothetical protein